MTFIINQFGWKEYLAHRNDLNIANDDLGQVGRVLIKNKGNYKIVTAEGIKNARVDGKYKHKTSAKKDYPTAGDWVVVKSTDNNQAIIQKVLPRYNYFARKFPISGGRKMKNGVLVGGYIEEQIICSNIDTAFIMMGLDQNFNIGRLERYITLSLANHLPAVILLNKIDLCQNPQEKYCQVQAIAKEMPVHLISAVSGFGIEAIGGYFESGKTVVFLGSSGVGKSTLLNQMFSSEVQAVNEVSQSNQKGQHTTTGTQLFLHEAGFMMMDTPGMRELQLWADEETIDSNFSDVIELVSRCYYSNCQHRGDYGCAIEKALQTGELDQKRYKAYLKQKEEILRLLAMKKRYVEKRK